MNWSASPANSTPWSDVSAAEPRDCTGAQTISQPLFSLAVRGERASRPPFAVFKSHRLI